MKWIGIFDKKALLQGSENGWRWVNPADRLILGDTRFEDYVKNITSSVYVVVELEIDEY